MKSGLHYGLKLLRSYISFKLGRPKPSYVVYCVTARCNLRCVFCSWWRKSLPELNTAEAIKLIDNMCDFGVSVIDFSGGEPLLRRDLEVLALRAKDYGVYTVLSTNGTLICEDRVNNLKRAFDIVNVSLDGFEETHDSTRGVHGAFKRALRGIELLRSVGVKVGIDLTIYKGNAHEVLSLFKWLVGKVDFISFQPVMPYPPSEDVKPSLRQVDAIVDELLKLKKLMPSYVAPPTWYIKALKLYFRCAMPRICDAGILYFMVDPDGTVYACNAVRESIMGNAARQSMDEVWNSSLRTKAIESTLRCKGCLSQCTTAISMAYRSMPSIEDLKGVLSLALKR